MNRFLSASSVVVMTIATAVLLLATDCQSVQAQDQRTQRDANQKAAGDPDQAAVDRSRKLVKTLDNVFKQTIVLITDKYVHDEGDFAAGSAAVLLFKNVSDAGDNKVRLLDATGDPINSENVAQDRFEREGIERLKGGANGHEQIVTAGGKPFLRAMTPVPVVMAKCIMCHAHYADVPQGHPIGAISYLVPIE